MSSKAKDYLSQLRFDNSLLGKLHSKYLANIRLVILLILSIVILGVSAFFTIPRRLNPEINIPIVSVLTIFPGAGPEDVEALVTTPIEDSLKSIEGVDTVTSTSNEGSSSIVINFLSSTDKSKALTDVQSQVNTVSVPEDAQDPVVEAFDFDDQPIWVFTLSTKSDLASLMKFSEIVKDDLEDLKVVDRVVVSGMDEQDIQVILNPEKIKDYGISPITISQSIQKATSSYPAGNITTEGTTLAVSINPSIATISDIRNLVVPVGTGSVKLSDIAEVSEKSKPGGFNVYVASKEKSPERVVQFSVFKTSNANIDDAEKKARELIEVDLKKYNNQFTLLTIQNSAEEITTQFSELYSEFTGTVILVFILLFLFLGLRQAIISSLTVPLTFLTSFAIINAMGLTLNFLTMFAFLISLGLLIDDTIVTVAAMTRYHKTGKFTSYQVGLMVWRDFITPLWSTTITTIWAFLPLLLSTGIIGEFIKSIPIVVTATMLSSTSIAVLITIPLMIFFLNPKMPRRVKILLNTLLLIALYVPIFLFFGSSYLLILLILAFTIFIALTYYLRVSLAQIAVTYINKRPRFKNVLHKSEKIVDNGVIDIQPLSVRYRRIIERILISRTARRKTIFAIVLFALLAYLLIPLGLVVNEFFPKSDTEYLYVNVELPQGTKLETTKAKAQEFLNSIRKTEDVEYVSAAVGSTFSGESGAGATGQNNFLVTLNLPPQEDRKQSSIDIAEDLRTRFGTYPDGKVTVQEVSGGPPAGSDLQIKLTGNDLKKLDEYANKTVAYLQKQNGVLNVSKSIKTGTSKIVFKPDEIAMNEADVSIDSVGLWLRTYASGLTLDTIKLDNKDKDIVLFTNPSGTPTSDDLSRLEVSTPTGSFPLLSLGRLELETNPSVITHDDGKRTISVSAGVAKGFVVTEKNKDLEEFAKNDLGLETGYFWTTGGVNEENDKSVQSIMQAMIISFLLILITMVLEFGSFRQALIAMLIIPLSIAGVFYVFALTGTPLSFPALIGILALFGIVVTHAIVVMEKINDNRREGMELMYAISDAASNRLEPVLLTSLATIAGLTPITISNPLWRGLGGAIIAGLLFSGAIKLFFVPVMYYNWFKEPDKKKVSTQAKTRIKTK